MDRRSFVGILAATGAARPQTLQQRMQGVVQHQQFFWWVGHVVIVLATTFHALYWFRFNWATKMALFWYRLAFLGAVGSYGVVVHKMFFRVLPRSPYHISLFLGHDHFPLISLPRSLQRSLIFAS